MSQPSQTVDPPVAQAPSFVQHWPSGQQTPWQQYCWPVGPHGEVSLTFVQEFGLFCHSQYWHGLFGLTVPFAYVVPSITHLQESGFWTQGSWQNSTSQWPPVQHMPRRQQTPLQQI